VTLDPEQSKLLIPLKREVAARFNSNHWLELGAITGELELIQNHSRLLRSLHFGDDDYEGCVLDVLITLAQRNPSNLPTIESYLQQTFEDCAQNVSSAPSDRRIVFSPSVFAIPDAPVDNRLVAVMMPFSAEMTPVYEAIRRAAAGRGLLVQRVDDLWEHSTVIQDIFSLIYRSFVVVCDFTGKNPNVFYECGVAHTLGKHVVPIAQHENDVPFDLRHHRYLRYLPNEEGLQVLTERLADRLSTLTNSQLWRI
jgi:hypothetical protein